MRSELHQLEITSRRISLGASSSGKRCLTLFLLGMMLAVGPLSVAGQAPVQQTRTDDSPSVARYLDPLAGMTADEAVAYALAHNGELLAARKEIEAAEALVKQAGLRPNPRLDVEGSRQIN